MNCAVESQSQTNFFEQDHKWMRLACLYAGRAQGHSWPNPAVGCVLISAEQKLVAVGATASGGRPHAEATALLNAAQAGKSAEIKGGTAYVTLEPCAHKGRGPACAELLVEAGLRRVVYAVGDPDERVNGKGRARLIEGGIDVQSGLCEQTAASGLSGFLSSRQRNRPYLISKIATSADGFISAAAGEQTWLTNDVSRRYVHDLRSRVDGLITGIQTVLVDNPALTCRTEGHRRRTPVRMVMDSDLRLPLDSKLMQTSADGSVIVFCAADADKAAAARLQDAGVTIVRLSRDKHGLVLSEGLEWCMQKGLSAVLVEAGSTLNHSLFQAGLLDRIIHLTAKTNINSGIPGLLYDANISSALAFPDDSAYIRSHDSYLYGDRLTIWQKTS